MKKRIVSLTCAALLTAALTACGSSPAEPEIPSAPTAATPTETTAETTLPAIAFEETVIVDDENCTFTITAIKNDSIWGYTLKAFLENKTDKELMFSLRNVSVNGFMCDPFWATSITAGMKANEDISFNSEDFKKNGITKVTDIEFTLDVYDNNDWAADHLVTDTFSIYPMGEVEVETFVREAQEGDIVLFDDENCTMIATGFDPDGIWGYTMNVYLENKTDKTLTFSIDEASVNGFMCDPYWAETVAPGKRSNTAVSWMGSDFEANGITEVESLTLPVRVYDSNNWMADDIVSETFTVNP